jgi:hypothetical protein
VELPSVVTKWSVPAEAARAKWRESACLARVVARISAKRSAASAVKGMRLTAGD